MQTTKNTHYLTIGQAAKQTGRSKSYIAKLIQNGNLSVIEKNAAGFKIDPAELFRVLDKNVHRNTIRDDKEQEKKTENAQENTRIAILEAELQAAKEALGKEQIERQKDHEERIREREEFKSQLRNAEKREGQLHDHLQRFTLMLEDERAKREEKKGVFGKWWGG